MTIASIVSIAVTGRVATVTLDCGYRANPLSMRALTGLTEAAEQFHACPELSAVVLTGRADGFSMGMDLKDPALRQLREQGLAERRIVREDRCLNRAGRGSC